MADFGGDFDVRCDSKGDEQYERVRHQEMNDEKSRFNEGQIIGMLREQESGATTAEVCRRHGISERTFYR